MTQYLAMEIACHECGLGAHVCHGIFQSQEEALEAMKDLEPNYFSNLFEVIRYDAVPV